MKKNATPSLPARVLALLAVALTGTLSFAASTSGSPPAARVAPVVDDYYGTKVSDPYRWMETPDNAELRDWMKAQRDHARWSFLLWQFGDPQFQPR